MKKFACILLTLFFMITVSLLTFAGQWQQIGTDWKYLKDDGRYAKSEWVLDNAKWYCFNDKELMLKNQWVEGLYFVGADGAMLVNTITPDGYQVDASGKWIQGYTGSATSSKAGVSSQQGNGTVKNTGTAEDLPVLSGSAYIGNKSTKKFHYPYCSSVDDMKDKNKVGLSSRDQAISKGYVPCKKCNP